MVRRAFNGDRERLTGLYLPPPPDAGLPDRVRQAIARAFSEAADHPEITQEGEQACDLRRSHFTKILGNGPSIC